MHVWGHHNRSRSVEGVFGLLNHVLWQHTTTWAWSVIPLPHLQDCREDWLRRCRRASLKKAMKGTPNLAGISPTPHIALLARKMPPLTLEHSLKHAINAKTNKDPKEGVGQRNKKNDHSNGWDPFSQHTGLMQQEACFKLALSPCTGLFGPFHPFPAPP